jgi:hypothetical protein
MRLAFWGFIFFCLTGSPLSFASAAPQFTYEILLWFGQIFGYNILCTNVGDWFSTISENFATRTQRFLPDTFGTAPK